MSEIILSSKKIQFADDNLNKAGLNFGSDAFYASSLVDVDGGVVIQGSEVGASTGFTGATDVGDVSEDTIELVGSVSENILTLRVDDNAITHDLTFPSSLGTSGQFLKNDGAGNLSFSEIVSGYGNNHPWIYGTTKQLWSSPYGNPFAVTPEISPVAPLVRSSNIANLPSFVKVHYNRDLQLIHGHFWTSSLLSWDQGSSYNYWDLRVSARLSGSSSTISSSGETPMAGSFFLFGNDTLQNVTAAPVANTMPTGGRPSDSTGIVVLFNLQHTDGQTPSIQILENGVVTKTIGSQVNMFENVFFDFRIQRRGNVLRIERPAYGEDYNSPSLYFVHEHNLDPSTVFTGTRWGIGCSTDGFYRTMFANCSYIECRVLEE